jgi:hypothetical protein
MTQPTTQQVSPQLLAHLKAIIQLNRQSRLKREQQKRLITKATSAAPN